MRLTEGRTKSTFWIGLTLCCAVLVCGSKSTRAQENGGLPPQPGAIAGTVFDGATSAPIAGATVFYAPFIHAGEPLWWEGNPAAMNIVPPSVTTNGNGEFGIDGLHPGGWHLAVRAAGYEPAHREVRVAPGATTDVRIALRPRFEPQPGSIGGVVSAAGTHQPIAGAHIAFRPVDDNDDEPGDDNLAAAESGITPPPNQVVTNEHGEYRINGLRPRHYKLEVSKEGFHPQNKIVRVISGETVIANFELSSGLQNGVLVGRVIDGRNEQPIEGAHIVVMRDGAVVIQEAPNSVPAAILGQAFTNQQGNFRIENLPVGPVAVQASAEGYRRETKHIGIKLIGATEIRFALHPAPNVQTGHIVGKVQDAENSNPLPRTLITLLPRNAGPGNNSGPGDNSGPGNAESHDGPGGNPQDLLPDHFLPFTLTNENGEFGFRKVPVGEYRILAVHLGFLPAVQNIAVATSEVTHVLFELTHGGPARPGSIAGRVVDARTSEPLARAWVRLNDPVNDTLENRHRLITHTDARGFYHFGHVRPGEYGIIAAKRGFVPERKPVKVESGERTRCDFALEHTTATATLTGTVVDVLTNEPIGGALIAVPLCELPGHAVNDDNALTTRTSPAGDYTLPGVPVGLQRVIAQHPDYFPQRKPVVIHPNQPNVADFELQPRPAQPDPLIVLAVDANTSAPLRGVKVHLALQEDAEPHSPVDHWHKVTNAQGIAIFPRVPEGDFVVTGELTGYLTAMTPVSNMDAASTVTLIMIPDPDLQTSTQWYFACGGISAFQQTWLLAVNPSATETANLALTLFFENDEPLTVVQDVAPNSRFTFNLNAIVRSNTDPTTPATRLIPFAMELISENGTPVFAERSIYWHVAGNPRGGGSDSIGATELSTEWIFAEGSTTGHRRTRICVGNPNDEATTVTVTYLLENADPVVAIYALGGERRLTINAADDVPNANFSMQLNSELPVVAEREMFGRANGHDDKWGHISLGVTEPSDTWLFAEGATHHAFVTFLLIANINDHPVTVDIRFLLSNGAPVEKSETVAARSRLTINVEARYPEMADQGGFGIELKTADGSPIVVERAIYWIGGGYTERSGATGAVGLTHAARRWLLPEGAVGGPSGFEDFILCANTADETAEVNVQFVKTDGTSITRHYAIGAGQRLTVKANDFINGEGTQSCSTIVESTNGVPVIVERAMYWANRLEGHASGGIPSDN